MTYPHQSRLVSLLLSTACLVAFGLVASPIIKPVSRASRDIEIRNAMGTEASPADLRVAAGKSVIMESSARIVGTSVADPGLVRAVAIDEHELLLNGKTPGRTNITLWQADGKQRKFDVHIDREADPSSKKPRGSAPDSNDHGLTGAYQNAMTRVQTAITGADR
jgi:Flp pilus assembly secretin CpaC